MAELQKRKKTKGMRNGGQMKSKGYKKGGKASK